MLNAFSIDVEEWFCPHFIKPYLGGKNWNELETRVESNVAQLLHLLKNHNVKATFFVLGKIAELHPAIVDKIAEEGHEIGIHGWDHTQVVNLSRDEFAQDIEKTLKSLSKINNFSVLGYRAPSFSIVNETLWALDILKSFGIKYDSSVYPDNAHPDYGIKGISKDIFSFENGMIEVPMNSVKLAGINFPCSGGAYFRLYPYSFSKFLIGKEIRQRPLIFYFHPWEIDEFIPPVKLNFLHKLRYSQGIKGNINKLEKLLNDFKFTSISNLLNTKGYNLDEN